MDLGVAVLAGLRSRHVGNLAGASLDNNKPVLAEGRALCGNGQRGVGATAVELVVLLDGTLVVGLRSLQYNS
ncbi:hypothetical protein RRF57_000625 [Xylaria bambusicola]|uniref:Uncharacterized protein n=1 Tax=Xylaria bambusicola TaxID=326684 RepID=A0AAN7UA46_9PEZI